MEDYYKIPRELFSEDVLKILDKPVVDEEFKAEVRRFGEVCQSIIKKSKEEKKEKQTLSDKVWHLKVPPSVVFREDDIKQHLKEFIESIENITEEEIMEERERRQRCGGEGNFRITFRNIAKQKAKKHFGDRLI